MPVFLELIDSLRTGGWWLGEREEIHLVLIGVALRIAEFKPVTAPATERKNITAVEAILKRARREIRNLRDPSPYAAILEAIDQPRAATAVVAERGRKRRLQLKLTANLVGKVMATWSYFYDCGYSLHENGVFVRLTAEMFEVATGRKVGKAEARRACAIVLDNLGVPRRKILKNKLEQKTRPNYDWLMNGPLADLHKRRAATRADMVSAARALLAEYELQP